ncbi:MAG TPA: rod shape-determining protein MreD [Phototrophicaceae bacterium]|nr:rod shape-determining protein MreD [Phototrophicaceae bacterium]
MGSYISLPILMLAAALQASIVPQFGFLGGRPDLVFLCVVAWAFNAPLRQALVWAFVGGILQDLLSAAPTGVSVIGLVLIAFALDLFRQQVYRVGLITIIVTMLAGSLVQQVLVMGLLLVSGFDIPIITSLGYVVFPTVVYNLAAILPVYVVLRWLQKRVAGRDAFFT